MEYVYEIPLVCIYSICVLYIADEYDGVVDIYCLSIDSPSLICWSLLLLQVLVVLL